ncbi:MAG: inosine monophosphate cyclohydrolase [Clostridiales bacterium]|jgi:IMP cyclohydrolase|nr:inosine monophosphate cyclohydrolase [Clostridiales bacterium]
MKDKSSLSQLLSENSYPGRGILIGKSENGKNAVCAYFIMGRSENSRNRIFLPQTGGIRTEAFDPAKMTDPSLIIYSPVRTIEKNIIVTNGDQTDTIYEHISSGKSFEQALETRTFEPDAPNFTPRISGIMCMEKNFSYKLSILKAEDAEGTSCSRFFFSYEPKNGAGHFIHTYDKDGSPLPSFQGEPKKVSIPNGINELSELIWDSLNEENKVSLYVSYVNLQDGEIQERIINKNVRRA